VLGAARTGRLVVRTLHSQPRLGLKPVFMLDDDARKQGTLRASWTNEAVEVRSASVSVHDLLSASMLKSAKEIMEGSDDKGPTSDVPPSPRAADGAAPTLQRPVTGPAFRARGQFAEVEGVPVLGDLTLAPILAARLKIRYAIVAMPGVESPKLVRLIERV